MAGKGDKRRKEDIKKVSESLERLYGKSKLEQRVEEEARQLYVFGESTVQNIGFDINHLRNSEPKQYK